MLTPMDSIALEGRIPQPRGIAQSTHARTNVGRCIGLIGTGRPAGIASWTDIESGGRIVNEHRLARVDPISSEVPRDESLCGEVQVGSRVCVRDAHGEEEYTIVRSVDADAAHGRISTESPVGRALLGGRRGEEVSVHTPGGIRALTIVKVTAPCCCSSGRR
jgi:Transcription elongation factor, GreA/GreB, C-term